MVFQQTDAWQDDHNDNDLQGTDRSNILNMLESFLDVLTDIPSSTNAT